MFTISHQQHHQGPNYIVGAAPQNLQQQQQSNFQGYNNSNRERPSGHYNKAKKENTSNMSSNYETNPVGALQVEKLGLKLQNQINIIYNCIKE